MRALLDTSAYSELMRGNPEIRSLLKRAELVLLNPIVLGELRSGFLAGNRRSRNEQALESFLARSGVLVAPIDSETADHYAILRSELKRAGSPVPSNDLWIAATAFQHGLRVLTFDAHFDKIPLIVVERLLRPPSLQ